ncbi:hypothetical protein E1B28_003659 [Marasmius oreades]|uniref:Uncharacterized protein n=1 Tax=Marasmius oreades TaxID=181124 RepID=A0A9P8ABH2_9AGAR|nr:uncharacterized protein E1B28_003659 [Marasmius oreades]KAG7096208.1 hypothetical protein E1B28_003659 [Marasmius oreades]
MLIVPLKKCVSVGEMVMHRWLESVVVQGEMDLMKVMDGTDQEEEEEEEEDAGIEDEVISLATFADAEGTNGVYSDNPPQVGVASLMSHDLDAELTGSRVPKVIQNTRVSQSEQRALQGSISAGGADVQFQGRYRMSILVSGDA